jgi:hypothetical protein
MPTTMGRPVKDLISRLLMHNPAARLGCAHGGTTEVVSHDFFANIDWMALERRAVEMPFVPQVNVRSTQPASASAVLSRCVRSARRTLGARSAHARRTLGARSAHAWMTWTWTRVRTSRQDDFDTSNFDQYSDDDQASAWVAYNTTNVDATWKQEFGDPAKD